jgi:hypothetical protein
VEAATEHKGYAVRIRRHSAPRQQAWRRSLDHRNGTGSPHLDDRIRPPPRTCFRVRGCCVKQPVRSPRAQPRGRCAGAQHRFARCCRPSRGERASWRDRGGSFVGRASKGSFLDSSNIPRSPRGHRWRPWMRFHGHFPDGASPPSPPTKKWRFQGDKPKKSSEVLSHSGFICVQLSTLLQSEQPGSSENGHVKSGFERLPMGPGALVTDPSNVCQEEGGHHSQRRQSKTEHPASTCIRHPIDRSGNALPRKGISRIQMERRELGARSFQEAAAVEAVTAHKGYSGCIRCHSPPRQ